MKKKLIIFMFCITSVIVVAYRYSIVNAGVPKKADIYEYKSGESAQIEDVLYTVSYEISDKPFEESFSEVNQDLIKKYVKLNITIQNNGEHSIPVEETVLFTNDLRVSNGFTASIYNGDDIGDVEPGEVKTFTKYDFLNEFNLKDGVYYYRAPSSFQPKEKKETKEIKETMTKEEVQKYFTYYEWKIEF
jgi:hypothetical protein